MRNTNRRTFVHKLFDILQQEGHTTLIDWSEDGNYFEIKDKFKLTQQVLEVQFKVHNYDSFVRQLNIYDFKKIDSASLMNASY